MIDDFILPLKLAFAKHNVPQHLQPYAVAQFHHESASFTTFEENLNYSAAGLLDTFPKYFTPSQAVAYARQPERIANRVYANRMGNGNEASGDGWRYRGMGIIQITGKHNHTRYRPESLDIFDMCMVAVAYYKDRCGTSTDIRQLTKLINGWYNGLDERIALTLKYKKEWK